MSLFIGGASDPSVELVASVYDELEAYLPGSWKKVLLPGVGHCAAEEEANWINKPILEFMERLTRHIIPSEDEAAFCRSHAHLRSAHQAVALTG